MKHLKTDLDFIYLVLTRGATFEDKQNILALYRKYLDPTLGNIQITNSSCSSCNSSLNTYWLKLKDYMAKNAEKFID